MNIEIKKYTPVLLKEFIESEEYYKMPVIPVSYHRAVSWLNNPKLDPGDVIMYLAIENNEMIGYRCILPDSLGQVKFGWLSGNWVKPSRRREGIATLLFEEARKDWNNKLMYTNYAPASKAVYDKTGQFNMYKELDGIRAHLRFDLAGLLPPKRKFFAWVKFLLKISDAILNFINDIRLIYYKRKFVLPEHGLRKFSEIDKELVDFFSKHGTDLSPFRGQQELNWIIHFPWVIEQHRKDDMNRKYYFTSTAKYYHSLNFKLFDSCNELVLYMMVVIVDKRMTVPYICCDNSSVDKAVDIITSLMFEKKVNYVTLFNRQLLNVISNRKLPFLLVKKMLRKYFATRELISEIPAPEEIFIRDGDGDCVFT